MNHLPRPVSVALCAAAACLLAAVLPAREARALGLGEIVVKSSYSKGFVAEIPVFLDPGETDLKAAVGSQGDYNMIQIGRPAFIDGLSVTVENGGAGKVVVIRSKEPITQPSFNLIIRATASGGTVLENYFLAVDFRKSLSLDLPPPEEHVAEAPKPEKKPTHTGIPTTPAPPPPPAPIPPLPVIEPPVPTPAPPVQIAAATEPASAPVAEPAPAVPAPQQEPEPVAAPASSVGATEAVSVSAPAVEKAAPAAATPTAEPAAPGLVKADADPVKNRVTVKRGDTLFSIARSLRAATPDLSRVVVAIYLENKDAFIDGNIHRLRAGATLNYDKVNGRAAGVKDEDARQLLSDNWKDLRKTEAAEPVKAPSVDLPFENAPSDQELADFLEKWRGDWVYNAPGFADRYAAGFHGYRGHVQRPATKDEWVASRRAFNELHSNMHVAIADVAAARGSVSFTQTFTSDQLFSVGKKTLSLTRENGELKITDERFVPGKAADRTHKWTVTFPTVQSRDLAIAHMQKLRGLGAMPYEAGGLPDGPYAVAAGRFATEAQAEDFVTRLKSAGEVDAKVVLFPFSVRMKATEDPTAAASAMAALSESGSFPFTVETATADGKTRHIVCVGAFATRDAALRARDALKIEGFDPQPVVP